MNNPGRYELKFVIDAEQRARFLQAARSGLQPDPHGQDAVYRVSSVYFDTPDFTAYWEKMDGEAVRRKYRLRYYSLDERSQHIDAAFMEIKHRINNTVYKQRLKLTTPGALAILQDDRQLARVDRHLANLQTADRAAIADIRRAARRGLQAKKTITYLREAWLGKVDDRLRVTFDSRGQAYAANQYADVSSNTGTPFMPADQVILEIKFNSAIPRWIRDILNQQHLVLQRFSKYAAGVESDAIGAVDLGQVGIPRLQVPPPGGGSPGDGPPGDGPPGGWPASSLPLGG